MQIELESRGVMTRTAIPVNVVGIANVNIRKELHILQTGLAARSFAGFTPDEVQLTCQQVLEGSQRAVVSEMSLEEINADRVMMVQKAQDIMEQDMSMLGVQVNSYQIKRLDDDIGYGDALGSIELTKKDAIAEVNKARQEADTLIKTFQREAETKIAEMENTKNMQIETYKQDAIKRGSETERMLEKVRQDREQTLKRMDKEYQMTIQMLANKKQESATQVRAEMAKVIAQTERNAQIKRQEIETKRREWETKLESATREVGIQAQNVEVARMTADRDVVKPAEAEAKAKIKEAEAQADALVRLAAAEATSIRTRAKANAEEIRVKGYAEADVTKTTGASQAVAMMKAAEAWKEIKSEALQQKLIDQLPKCAEAISAPLNNAEIIRIEGEGSGNDFATALAGQAATLEVLSALTDLEGDDLKEAAASYWKSENSGENDEAARVMSEL